MRKHSNIAAKYSAIYNSLALESSDVHEALYFSLGHNPMNGVVEQTMPADQDPTMSTFHLLFILYIAPADMYQMPTISAIYVHVIMFWPIQQLDNL